jgi:(1->4)-alpha-D-glucan 1-alpha-D-glucosylmutase
VVPYLHDLGVSDCYTSPILRPRHGSTHGYDVCDHGQLNPELGGAEGFETFAAALRQRKMGLLLDVVPNHMGVGDPANGWWADVLENGPASRYARYFDIDWHPVNPDLDSKVLLPILRGLYGKVLERGEIRLSHAEGRFCLHHHDLRLPVAPRSVAGLLELCIEELIRHRGEADEGVAELRSILTAIKYLPPRTALDAEAMTERYREKESIRRRLARLVETSAEVRAALDRSLAQYNGAAGDPRSFDRLDALINAQSYRPAFWRVAAEEINYRRFFDINELAAIRMELPEVFEAAHALVLRLLEEGKVNGLRIDHPDGLRDPTGYFRQLQRACFLGRLRNRLSVRLAEPVLEEQFQRLWEQAPARPESSPGRWPLYVVAEKILTEEEPLPADWAVAGTTGYDFLAAVNGVFVDTDHQAEFDRIYRDWTGRTQDLAAIVYRAKRGILQSSMASEINSLGHRLDRITERNRHYRDFTLNNLRLAIREVIAALPVYRTYVTGPDHVPGRDRHFIDAAVTQARHRNPNTAREVFDFLRDLLILRNLGEFAEADRELILGWVLRFQQLTGPIMAKGVEDTAFYIYNRLVSLNEVGGHPDRFGLSVEAFHAHNAERQRHWPGSLLASSTHDTKRSEDVRARLNVLSELPGEWERALERWRQWNAPHLVPVNDRSAPSANDQYLLYQTLVGAWPPEPVPDQEYAGFRRRVLDYMLKAAKEAKVHTSWINPDRDYEAALQHFIERVLPDGGATPFVQDLLAFQRRVAHFGYLNSLSQVVLKLTCPGVPDIYQGCELWDFSLVDPDNRRAVDYDRRREALQQLRQRIQAACGKLAPLAAELLASWTDGRVKMYVLHRLLVLRRDRPRLFEFGEYHPLIVDRLDPGSVVAFARRLEDQALVVAVPRRVVRLLQGQEHLPIGAVWGQGRLLLPGEGHGTSYRQLFTGDRVAVEAAEGGAALSLAEAFRAFPVAVLLRE